ncbi:hypothetical protein GFY24_16930 [Nocardia sp. SYP-A9097]|uniref:hypothetical protein n=1 Tax=Nocardia sp. SYP-A9097 TaxID=2663237 RepID=UPI00129AC9A4|nr:hypothetical protein [Nocardia sp. SYP-A9097]MRH89113.1 hypothetical protein [Nocardia sp. SYP-A9097]
MINLVLILAILDIGLMSVLVVIYWIPPLYRLIGDIPLVQRYWRANWGHPRSLIPFLILAGVAILWGLVYLLDAL